MSPSRLKKLRWGLAVLGLGIAAFSMLSVTGISLSLGSTEALWVGLR